MDAALGVAAYLRARASPPSRQLFALRDPGGTGTFEFAAQFAAGDEALAALQAAEGRDAQARVDAHWAEVRRKQALAAQLRATLSRLRVELASLDASVAAALRDLHTANSKLHWYSHYSHHLEQSRCAANFGENKLGPHGVGQESKLLDPPWVGGNGWVGGERMTEASARPLKPGTHCPSTPAPPQILPPFVPGRHKAGRGGFHGGLMTAIAFATLEPSSAAEPAPHAGMTTFGPRPPQSGPRWPPPSVSFLRR